MERYIGMGVHAASCTLAVVSQTGRRLKDFPVETNGQALVEAVRMIPGQKHLVFEEGKTERITTSDGTLAIVSRPSPRLASFSLSYRDRLSAILHWGLQGDRSPVGSTRSSRARSNATSWARVLISTPFRERRTA